MSTSMSYRQHQPMEGVEQSNSAPPQQLGSNDNAALGSSVSSTKNKPGSTNISILLNSEGNPVLRVWILSLNRHVSTDEIVRGLNKIEEEDIRRQCLNKSTRDECIRTMMGKLFPRIVLSHKFKGKQWVKMKANNGKEYFHNPEEDVCYGYSTADVGSLVAMAWSAGSLRRVVNCGVHVLKFSIPRGTTVQDYFQSVKHRLTDAEQRDAMNGGADEILFRRILIILTLKQAYISAINQPPGFDYRRISCDVPRELILVDGKKLVGWEIFLFKTNLGVQRKETIVEEIYQCCAVIYRGWPDKNKWNWNRDKSEMADQLNFLKVDQIVKAYDSMGDGKRKLEAHQRAQDERRRSSTGPENQVRIPQTAAPPPPPQHTQPMVGVQGQ